MKRNWNSCALLVRDIKWCSHCGKWMSFFKNMNTKLLYDPATPLLDIQFSSVQSLSHVWLFVTQWTAARQASLSITNTWSIPKPMSIELVMPWNHFILCRPLLLLPSIFPSIRVFPMSQLFASGGQRIGVSASTSVLPMNTQDWSPLGGTRWISCSPRDSQEFCPTPQFKSINSSALSRVQTFVTPWTVARQTPLSMGFSRQEYWSGLPCPSPGDLPHPVIESASLMSNLHC